MKKKKNSRNKKNYTQQQKITKKKKKQIETKYKKSIEKPKNCQTKNANKTSKQFSFFYYFFLYC